MKIVKEEIIPSAIALKYLEQRAKRGELKYEQKNSIEHLKKFVKLDNKQVTKISEELKKIAKLRDRHIAAIIDFLPEDKEELKIVLHKDFSILSEEEINQILEIVKKF